MKGKMPPKECALPDEDAALVLADRAFIAGAKVGFNLGVGEDRHELHRIIEARMKDIREHKASIREKSEGK